MLEPTPDPRATSAAAVLRLFDDSARMLEVLIVVGLVLGVLLLAAWLKPEETGKQRRW